MFQRRTSSSLSASVPSAYAKQAHGHSMRRRVKRRSYYSSGFWGDSRTLLMLVVLVTVLLAVFAWLGVQVYSALYYYHGSVGDSRYSHHRHPHLGRTVYAPQDEEEDEDDDWEVLPYNHIYRIPEAMDIMGDRSDEYARLRKEVDGILPPDSERSLQRVKDLTKKYASIGTMPQGPHHSDSVREPYDIYNCPDTPPEGYPFEWKLVDEVLAHWPVTEIENVPSKVHQGLCIFDYQKDYDKALRYRQAELPFVVVNNPDVARTAERWSIPGYLSEMTGKTTKHRAEYNTNGHFLYNMPTKKDRLRKQHRRAKPLYDDKEEETEQLRDSQGRLAVSQRTDIKPQALRMTFDDWLEKANKTHVGMEDEHYYFRLIGCGYMDPTGGCDHGSSEYVVFRRVSAEGRILETHTHHVNFTCTDICTTNCLTFSRTMTTATNFTSATPENKKASIADLE